MQRWVHKYLKLISMRRRRCNDGRSGGGGGDSINGSMCIFLVVAHGVAVLIGCVRERERRRIIGADENHQNPITRLRI